MAHKNKRVTLYVTLGIFFWILAVIFLIMPIWPYVYYRLSPQTSTTLASTLAATSHPQTPQQPSTKEVNLPDFDSSLPTKNGLIIDKIGLRGEIHEGTNWEEILQSGIWRVPNFGTPEQPGLPVILAAHRWGYVSWSNAFRHLNSFYNLPKLKVGDTVDLIWNQRKYTYKIYATDSAQEILDYTADLILYTCQLWNSPVRIIVYAERV